MKTSHLHVTHTGEPVQFGLDGEMLTENELTADSRLRVMRFFVGPTYDPSPEEWGGTTRSDRLAVTALRARCRTRGSSREPS